MSQIHIIGALFSRSLTRFYRQTLRLLLWTVMLSLAAACTSGLTPPTPTPNPVAQVLVVYGWANYIPQTILDDFTEKYGIQIRYESFGYYGEATSAIRAGEAYDVVLLSGRATVDLIAENLLAEIDFEHVPNFRNVNASFRDLAFDPSNRYSIPIRWGTTGLLVRTDLVDSSLHRWSDLWDPSYAGKIGLWPHQRMVLGIALKSLGYSVNTEDPVELEAALDHLLALKPNIFWLDLSMPDAADVLVDGQAHIVYGWANDVRATRERMEAVTFIYPEEGTILWLDNLVIPANTVHYDAAALFINFLLDAHNSAQMTNELYEATLNDAASAFINPEHLADPVIFPTEGHLQNAELPLPLNTEVQNLYDDIWRRFLQD